MAFIKDVRTFRAPSTHSRSLTHTLGQRLRVNNASAPSLPHSHSRRLRRIHHEASSSRRLSREATLADRAREDSPSAVAVYRFQEDSHSASVTIREHSRRLSSTTEKNNTHSLTLAKVREGSLCSLAHWLERSPTLERVTHTHGLPLSHCFTKTRSLDRTPLRRLCHKGSLYLKIHLVAYCERRFARAVDSLPLLHLAFRGIRAPLTSKVVRGRVFFFFLCLSLLNLPWGTRFFVFFALFFGFVRDWGRSFASLRPIKHHAEKHQRDAANADADERVELGGWRDFLEAHHHHPQRGHSGAALACCGRRSGSVQGHSNAPHELGHAAATQVRGVHGAAAQGAYGGGGGGGGLVSDSGIKFEVTIFAATV